MKTLQFIRCGAAGLALVLSALSVVAQPFSSGSTGTDGPLDLTIAGVTTVVRVPESGILNYTRIRMAPGTRLTFERNTANTPVYLLASDEVLIEGAIDVSGAVGGALDGGLAGPGGFDGGRPGIAGAAPGAGYGPGGGKGGASDGTRNGVGSGSYATVAILGDSVNKGATYGTELLIPFLGGSGGGGMPGLGGGGGGGAVLIASSQRITVANTGSIDASAGISGFGYGSGGAIRLIAPAVAGNGRLSVSGYGFGGNGRIRIDLVDRRALNLSFDPGTPGTLVVGGLMAVFPPVTPQLDIVRVGALQIAPGTRTPVLVRLPFGASPSQVVEVRARDFNQSLTLTVALIPDSGAPAYYPISIDNFAANPATKTVTVSFPPNILTRVMAWTR